MDIQSQLSVFASNQPGVLANICGLLSDEKINIFGFTVVDHIDHSLVRLVVDNPTKAAHLLGEAGLLVLETEVIRLNVHFGPGSLESVAQAMSDASLNIDYAYATEPQKDGGSTLFLKTNDNTKALAALRSLSK